MNEPHNDRCGVTAKQFRCDVRPNRPVGVCPT